MKGINIFLADGFEDMEALAVNDVLRRGGLDVCLVSIGEDPFVVSSHGVTVGPEAFLYDFDEDHTGTGPEDFMIFPGGMPGTKNLAASEALVRAMREHYAEGGSLAAICAAPGLVLSQLKDVQGLEFTCFDGFQDYLIEKGAKFVNKPAVKSGRIITGRSAGHAVAFALEILKAVNGEEAAEKVRYALMLDTK
ncbi:MAG: DJ-1/PfpI family protein [Bacteroidales bacterium]|nr:DJ-1/PfpI family protein [Bacteroidales bacterium]